MYKPDLALNNLQWLMCHKTKPIFHRVLLQISLLSLLQIANIEIFSLQPAQFRLLNNSVPCCVDSFKTRLVICSFG